MFVQCGQYYYIIQNATREGEETRTRVETGAERRRFFDKNSIAAAAAAAAAVTCHELPLITCNVPVPNTALQFFNHSLTVGTSSWEYVM